MGPRGLAVLQLVTACDMVMVQSTMISLGQGGTPYDCPRDPAGPCHNDPKAPLGTVLETWDDPLGHGHGENHHPGRVGPHGTQGNGILTACDSL
jgi:hypothetical protein